MSPKGYEFRRKRIESLWYGFFSLRDTFSDSQQLRRIIMRLHQAHTLNLFPSYAPSTSKHPQLPPAHRTDTPTHIPRRRTSHPQPHTINFPHVSPHTLPFHHPALPILQPQPPVFPLQRPLLPPLRRQRRERSFLDPKFTLRLNPNQIHLRIRLSRAVPCEDGQWDHVGGVGAVVRGIMDFMDRVECVDLDFYVLDGEGGRNGE